MPVPSNSLRITAPLLQAYTPLPSLITGNDDFGTWLDTINNLITYNKNISQSLGITSSGGSVVITNPSIFSSNVNFDNGTLFVDSVNNRVGIGNTTPGNAFRVEGIVSVGSNVTFDQNLLVQGNLEVNGVINYINTTTLEVGDTKIILNANLPNTTEPFENAQLIVNRGASSNVELRWNETLNLWQLTNDGTTYEKIIVPSMVANTTANGVMSNTTQTFAGTKTFRDAVIHESTLSVSGTTNALSTLGVSGATNALGTLGVTGAANALGTLGVGGTLSALGQLAVVANAAFNTNTLFVDAVHGRVGVGNTTPQESFRVEGVSSFNGAVNALSTLGVSGAINALSTFGVTGAANALSTLGVGGLFSALGWSFLYERVNAYSTVGVAGMLSALDQLVVVANANFDEGTLFVDAINHRVGVGNTNPGAGNKLVVDGKTVIKSTSASHQLEIAYNENNHLRIAVDAQGNVEFNAVASSGSEDVRIKFLDHVTIDANKKLYLDGGSDTYLFGTESNTIAVVTGNDYTLLINSVATTINTAIYSGPSIPFASRTTGWGISRAGSADFRYVYADEMHVKNFIADLEQALAGGQIISKSVAVLHTDFVAPEAGATTTLYVEDLPGATGMQVFQASDYVVLRTFTRSGGSLTVADCVGTVSSPTTGLTDANGVKYQTWTFTRASGGNAGTMTAGTTVEAGVLVLDYGVSGSGYYEVTAVDGAYAEYAPYAQIVTWTSAPVSTNRTLRARFGNLKGVTAEAGEYGIIAGDYTGKQYFRASNKAFDLYGIDLRMFSSSPSTPSIVLSRGTSNTNPYFAIGNAAPSSFTSGTGIWMGRDATVVEDVESAYRFRVGNPNGVRLSWNGASLLLGDTGNENLQINSSAVYFFDSNEVLGYLSNKEWLLGNTQSTHLIINTVAISLNAGAVQYAQFAADTRLGAVGANHLLLNSTAIMFRSPSGTSNLVTINSTTLTVGVNTDSHVFVNSSAVVLKSGSTEYGKFAATTIIGRSTQPHVEIASTSVKIFKDSTTAGVVLNSDGSGSLSTGNISWNTTGDMTMTGTITASAGSIGGWTVNTTALVKDTGTASTSAGLIPTDYPFYAGQTYAGRASAPFRVTTAGAITATSGSVGGWTLAASTLTGGSLTFASSGNITAGSGNDVARVSADDATYRLWIGHATAASASFSVTKSGGLYATGATISGAITATSGSFTGSITSTSGSIGGWTIGASTLTGGSLTLTNSGNITAGSGNDVARVSADDATYRLWIGHATSTSAPFRVTKGGVITATNITITGGSVGGWTPTSTALSVTSSGQTAGMDAAGTYRFYAGATGAPSFTVTGAGVLSATGATISGSVTASSGSIGGWTIGASTLTGGSLTFASSGNITAGSGNDVARVSADDATYRLWIGHATASSAPFRVNKLGGALISEVVGDIMPSTAGYWSIGSAGREWYSFYGEFFGIKNAYGLRYLVNPASTSTSAGDIATWVYDAGTGHYVGGKYTSSLRYKTNLELLTPSVALDTILKLVPKKYHRIGQETQRKEAGFIAEEVQTVVPDLTTSSGEPEPGVAILEVIAYLVGAIQNLNARLNSLEANLAK